jgi:excisionase family DNA binding protein
LAYSVTEAAQLLGLSARSVRYLLKEGKLGFCRVGRRIVITQRDLERLLKQAYVRPVQPLEADAPIRPVTRNMKVSETAIQPASECGATDPPTRGDVQEN